MLLGACNAAPRTAPAASQSYTPPRPDTWAKSRLEELDTQSRQLRTPVLVEDWEAIGRRVEQVLPKNDKAFSGATAEQVRQMKVASATNFLIEAGYRAEHLAAEQQGYSLITAAASGWGDADALVLLSPMVLVADLDRIDRKPDNSAYLVYRVTEPIKSSPPVGSEFRLLLNPPFPTIVPKPGDPPPPPPPPNPPMWELAARKSAVFFLQPPETIVRPLGSELPSQPRMVFGPMPIEGERVLPGYHSMTAQTTLPAIRATARAQLCSPGYLPVVQGVDLPHKC
jgi:hypothetical protein